VSFSKCAACHYKIRFSLDFMNRIEKFITIFGKKVGFLLHEALFYGFALPLWYLCRLAVLSLFFSLLELFTIGPCFCGFLCLILDLVFGLPVFHFHLVPTHLFVVGDVAVVQH